MADCAGVLESVPSEMLAAGATLGSSPSRVLAGMTSLRLVSMPTYAQSQKVFGGMLQTFMIISSHCGQRLARPEMTSVQGVPKHQAGAEA